MTLPAVLRVEAGRRDLEVENQTIPGEVAESGGGVCLLGYRAQRRKLIVKDLNLVFSVNPESLPSAL